MATLTSIPEEGGRFFARSNTSTATVGLFATTTTTTISPPIDDPFHSGICKKTLNPPLSSIVHIAVPAGGPSPLEWAAGAGTTASMLLGIVLVSPTTATISQRAAAVVSATHCYDAFRLLSPPPIWRHPLRFALPPSPNNGSDTTPCDGNDGDDDAAVLSMWRGAFVGGLALLATVIVLQFACVATRYYFRIKRYHARKWVELQQLPVQQRFLSEAQAQDVSSHTLPSITPRTRVMGMWPGAAISAFVSVAPMVLEPSVAAGFVAPQHPSSIVVAVTMAVLYAAVIVQVARKTSDARQRGARLRWRPPPPTTNLSESLERFLEGDSEWVSDPPLKLIEVFDAPFLTATHVMNGYAYFRGYFALFSEYNRTWYFALDLTLTAVSLLVANMRSSSPNACVAVQAIVAILTFSIAAFHLTLRPQISLARTTQTTCFAILTFIAGVLAIVSRSNGQTFAWVVLVMQPISTATIIIGSGMLRFGRISSSSVKASELHATLLQPPSEL